MVEHAMYGSKQHVQEFLDRYNWLLEQIVGLDNSSF